MIDYTFVILNVFRFCILLSDLSGIHKIFILLLSSIIPTTIQNGSVKDITQLSINERLYILSTLSKLIFYFMLLFISCEDKLLTKKQIYVLIFFIFLRFINTVTFVLEQIEHKKQMIIIPDIFIPLFLLFIGYNYLKVNK